MMNDEDMMDNEDRADLGMIAVMAAATLTNVAAAEWAGTALTDVLSYMAHLCDRLGLDPRRVFAEGIESYEGDFEDGPRAAQTLEADRSLEEQPGSLVGPPAPTRPRQLPPDLTPPPRSLTSR